MAIQPINPGSQSDIFSAEDLYPVTPSDADDLPFIARALRAQTGGDLRITSGIGLVRDTFIGDGEFLPVVALRVHLSGTTAAGLEAVGWDGNYGSGGPITIAPYAIGTISSQSWTQGVPASLDLTPYIGGSEPISLSVIGGALPDGMTIFGKLISGVPATAVSGSVQIRASNSAGFVDLNVFSWAVAATDFPRIATTEQSSITWRGVTYEFNIPVRVASFPDGQPFVVSDRVFQITRVTPDSVQIPHDAFNTQNGSGQVVLVPAGSYWANGLVADPYIGAVPVQGHDEIMSTHLYPSGQGATQAAYNHALNIDPSIKGAISISVGQETSLVKCIRRAGLTTPTAEWRLFDNWAVLHVLKEAPWVGSVAPAPEDLDKTIYTRAGLRNKATLGAGFTRASGMPSIEDCLAQGYFRTLQPFWVRAGEIRRRMMIQENNLSGNGYSGGTAGYGQFWGDFMAAMLAAGQDCPDEAIEMALAMGAQLIGLLNRGDNRQGGAGQNCGHKQFVQFFGHYFRDIPGLMAKCLQVQGNVTNQQFWVTPDMEGEYTKWPGNHFVYFGVCQAEHIGRPRWAHTVLNYRPSPMSYFNGNINADYEYTVGPPNFVEMTNILMLKEGPGGLDGGQVLLEGGPMNNTNPPAGAIAYNDSLRTFNTGVSVQLPRLPRHTAYYDAMRNTSAVPRWTGTSEPFSPDTGNAPYLTAIAQGFSWNLTNMGGHTETVLQYRIQYSRDQKYWKNVTSPGVTGSQTGLSARLLYVRWQVRTASGWSPWSVNYPRTSESGAAARLTITPTSSAASVPAAVVSPGIYVPKYPKNRAPLYDLAGATIPADTPFFFVSAGDRNTNITAVYSYDLYVNGSIVITGQTDFDIPIYPLTSWLGVPMFARVRESDGNTFTDTQTVTLTAAPGANTGTFYPTGVVGQIPLRMTRRWGVGNEMTLVSPGYLLAQPAVRTAVIAAGDAGVRLWSLDELLPIGDLSNVPEGEVRMEIGGTGGGTTNQEQRFVLRATGSDAASANGYEIRFNFSTTTRGLQIFRVSAGVRSAALNFTIPGGGTSNSYQQPAGGSTGIAPGTALTRTRVDWAMVGGSLRIRAKSWWESNDDENPYTEPVDWGLTYTDASPLPSGRIGFGASVNAVARDLFGMGVGVGAGVLAPIP